MGVCSTQPPTSHNCQSFNESRTDAYAFVLTLPEELITAHLHHITKCNFLEDRRDAHLLNYIYKRRDDPDYQDTRDLNTRVHDGRTLKVTMGAL